jgi:hypothetical protein
MADRKTFFGMSTATEQSVRLGAGDVRSRIG